MVVLLAGILEFFVADLRCVSYPASIMRRVVDWTEKKLYAEQAPASRQVWAGTVAAVSVLAAVYNVVTWPKVLLYYETPVYIRYVAEAAVLAFTIGPCRSARAAMAVQQAVQCGQRQRARYYAERLAGGDTALPAEADPVRVTMTRVAKNTVDSIVSPLFFFVLLGLPGAVVYRVVHMLASRWGDKRQPYYRYFGRTAVRLEAILNYIPVRLTCIFLILAAFFASYDWRGACYTARRTAFLSFAASDGGAEATIAGALHRRSGEYSSDGETCGFRPVAAASVSSWRPAHITGAVHLMYGVYLIALVLTAVVVGASGWL